jgi:cell division protein FtsI (penicillin-binding protein 3)
VEGYEIDPENGKDIFTTIDVNMQDIAENALLSMMIENECEHGTCVVMETATGKIKAMANLGRQPDGSYWEDLNYAIRASEPGSTFKLATLLSLLDDHEVKLSDRLNIEGGTWKIGTRTVHDAEKQEVSNVTVEEAFEHSSNVGMAKLVVSHYSHNPQKFVDNIKRLRLNQITGIDLAGETSPIVKSPKSRTWSSSTLPWMAFGYEVLVSPLQTLTLYNAVANNGRMMKPYLVNSVQYAGGMDRQFQPVVLIDKVCSDETLADLKTCLEGVCIRGTAKTTLKNTFYPVAGKTGTALIANGNRGYADHIYQSSFAGYFPADHPRYSCIVVIRNKPFAKKYLGAQVAGPVFREVADKLMSLDVQMADSIRLASYTSLLKKDSSAYYYAGESDEIKKVFHTLQMNYADSSRDKRWSGVYRENNQPVIKAKNEEQKQIPDVKGMGLKDALFLLESKDIKVTTRGTGKVKQQSIPAGSIVSKNQKLILDLN